MITADAIEKDLFLEEFVGVPERSGVVARAWPRAAQPRPHGEAMSGRVGGNGKAAVGAR